MQVWACKYIHVFTCKEILLELNPEAFFEISGDFKFFCFWNFSGFELQFFQSSNRLRAKTEVMEEISSQNSDLGLEDLDKLEAKGQAENTKRATSFHNTPGME